MKGIGLNQLLLINILFIFLGCSSVNTIDEQSKQLQSRKIYLKKRGGFIEYKIGIVNISKKPAFIITKTHTPYTPDGKACFNLVNRNVVEVIYTSDRINSTVYYNTSKNGDYWKKLAPQKEYVFEGVIEVKKCRLFEEKNLEKDKSSENTRLNDKKKKFTLFISSAKGFNCKESRDCKKFNKNEFELSLQEIMKFFIDIDGFKTSQFLFDIDEDEKQ